MDIPESFETSRLTLRCPLPGDGAELNRAVQESFSVLRPWMPWAQTLPTPEQSEAFARQARCRYLAREDLTLNLYLKGSGTLVGSSGLHRIDWSVPRFEIGYWCRVGFQRQGYISEAVAAIAAFAFDHLKAVRVEIRCDAANQRSLRVPERLGFELEGRLRQQARAPDGRLSDTLVYARVRPGAS